MKRELIESCPDLPGDLDFPGDLDQEWQDEKEDVVKEEIKKMNKVSFLSILPH